MSATPDSTLADPQQVIAELQRQLAERTAPSVTHCRARRGAGPADRDRRGVAGHQFLARRSRAGVRRDAGKGARGCARLRFGHLLLIRRRALSSRGDARHAERDWIVESLRSGPVRPPGSPLRRCSRASGSSRSPILPSEAHARGQSGTRAVVEIGGVRTLLVVASAQGRCPARCHHCSTARRSDRSPKADRAACRISRRRRSSRWRTRG